MIELKLEKKIKFVNSNRNGGYYGIDDEINKNPSPFMRYL